MENEEMRIVEFTFTIEVPDNDPRLFDSKLKEALHQLNYLVQAHDIKPRRLWCKLHPSNINREWGATDKFISLTPE